jgi:hypothetical protein
MDSFIRIFDEVITEEYCRHLIDKFKAHKDLWVGRNTLTYNFNEINLIEQRETFSQEFEKLGNLFTQATDHYAQTCKLNEFQWPMKYGLEEIRMKHYVADEGQFKPHVDAGDYLACTRFLVMFLYLNDGEGGETEFLPPHTGTVERKAGRLLCFPPHWTYPHAGKMPIGTDKYIIGSYMRYVSPQEEIDHGIS